MQVTTDKENTIDLNKLPNHVGIIMDGNGRWAKKRNYTRSKGHLEGLQAAKQSVKTASDVGIKYLSLYTFSTENWKRARQEVSYLMLLIRTYLKKEFAFYKKNKIRVIHSGDSSKLSIGVVKAIKNVVKKTKDYHGLTLNLAINYGGKDEIIRACNRFLAENNESRVLVEENIQENLDQPNIPPIDLVIRTGGDLRLSNFFIWQSVYAEFFFSKKLWPDWGRDDFLEVLLEYQSRERRYGGVK